MSACSLKDDALHLVVLIYLSIGIPAVLCCALSAYFAHKWVNHLDSEYRRQMIPRLCAVIMVLLPCERLIRLAEVVTWYHSSDPIPTRVLYNSNNTICLCGSLGSIALLLITKLKVGFATSSYAVSDRELRILQTLASVAMLAVVCFFVMNDIGVIYNSLSGTIALAVIFLVSSLSFFVYIFRVNLAFVERLRSIVVLNADSSGPGRVSTMNRSDDPELDGMVISKKSTLNGIKQAKLSAFSSQTHRSFLMTATKSTIISLSLSLSLLMVTVSGILYLLGECGENLATPMGHFIQGLAYLMTGVSVLCVLRDCETEYRFFFSKCDVWIQRVVVYKTEKDIRDLTLKRQQTVASNVPP